MPKSCQFSQIKFTNWNEKLNDFLTTYERNLKELGIKYANQITLLAEYKIEWFKLIWQKKFEITWVKLKI